MRNVTGETGHANTSSSPVVILKIVELYFFNMPVYKNGKIVKFLVGSWYINIVSGR
jgi:hypothetical protein